MGRSGRGRHPVPGSSLRRRRRTLIAWHRRGDYTIEGITPDEEVLFSLSFDMPVNPHAVGMETSFVFTLPVHYGWAGNLDSITLSGPEGTAVLDKTTDRPMAILQDPVTGQVRAFLSDLPAGGSDRSVSARVLRSWIRDWIRSLAGVYLSSGKGR